MPATIDAFIDNNGDLPPNFNQEYIGRIDQLSNNAATEQSAAEKAAVETSAAEIAATEKEKSNVEECAAERHEAALSSSLIPSAVAHQDGGDGGEVGLDGAMAVKGGRWERP
mmetsp:Transcript_62149/g.183732  ORF Transcript_62149/g.183732 Transcript_62149/m.183732 type:complete len:112 (-) Transcript_62149:60-395(-)